MTSWRLWDYLCLYLCSERWPDIFVGNGKMRSLAGPHARAKQKSSSKPCSVPRNDLSTGLRRHLRMAQAQWVVHAPSEKAWSFILVPPRSRPFCRKCQGHADAVWSISVVGCVHCHGTWSGEVGRDGSVEREREGAAGGSGATPCRGVRRREWTVVVT